MRQLISRTGVIFSEMGAIQGLSCGGPWSELGFRENSRKGAREEVGGRGQGHLIIQVTGGGGADLREEGREEREET